MKRIKYSNGSLVSKFNSIVDFETNVRGNQNFQSVESRATAQLPSRLGNTRFTYSRYKDSNKQRGIGRGFEHEFRSGVTVGLTRNKKKFGGDFTQLRISKPL